MLIIEPAELVHLFGALRSHTVLHGQHHKDGIIVGHIVVIRLATFVYESGNVVSIGASWFMDILPFLDARQLNIRIFDPLVSEKESDSLLVGFEFEENELCHLVFVF